MFIINLCAIHAFLLSSSHQSAGFTKKVLYFFFITGWWWWVLASQAVLSNTVFSRTTVVLLSFFVAEFADPHLFFGVKSIYDGAGLGALAANQKPTASAVMFALGEGEDCEAAHASLGDMVRNPGGSISGAWRAASTLQQVPATLLNVLHPGLLLLQRKGRHKKRLRGRTNQPLVLEVLTVLQILHLDVLWKDRTLHENMQLINQKCGSAITFWIERLLLGLVRNRVPSERCRLRSCSPRRMTFCFLNQRSFIMMLPYTRTSLKRKKALRSHFFRPCFIRLPFPNRTRPGWSKGCLGGLKDLSSSPISLRFSLSNTSWSMLSWAGFRNNAALQQPSAFYWTWGTFQVAELWEDLCVGFQISLKLWSYKSLNQQSEWMKIFLRLKAQIIKNISKQVFKTISKRMEP